MSLIKIHISISNALNSLLHPWRGCCLQSNRKILTTTSLLALLLFSTGCVSLVRPNFSNQLVELRQGQYQLDKTHSFLNFRIEHLGLSKLVGRFNDFTATLDFDPQNPQQLKLEGLINSASIDLNNKDLEQTIREPNWLHSEAYPQIIFTSESTEVTQDNQLLITGTLTLRGISLPLEIQATFNGGADNLLTRKYTIGFTATAKLNRVAFGIDKFTAFVGNTVEVELHGEFQRQE